jgi:hypothetical protein
VKYHTRATGAQPSGSYSRKILRTSVLWNLIFRGREAARYRSDIGIAGVEEDRPTRLMEARQVDAIFDTLSFTPRILERG